MTEIDLLPLKRLLLLLPESCDSKDKCIHDTIEAISVACFHAVFPMRMALAKDWMDKHYIPSGARQVKGGSSLLEQLGLLPPPQPIRRRA